MYTAENSDVGFGDVQGGLAEHTTREALGPGQSELGLPLAPPRALATMPAMHLPSDQAENALPAAPWTSHTSKGPCTPPVMDLSERRPLLDPGHAL